MAQTKEHQDRDQTYLDYFSGKQREFLKTLICDEVIAEYRDRPLGQHSEPLERLLLYFRRLPNTGKLIIKKDEASGVFQIAALSGVRGVPPTIVDDEKYTNVEAAYHGIFLKQISSLKES